jgi:tetratricopeptide (TPR) repeat protein
VGKWRGESFTIALDGREPNDGPRTFGVGIEILTLKTFVLRGGYTSGDDLGNGLRVGGGLRFKTFQIDYAFAGEGSLGNVNRLGITFFFGSKPTNTLVLAENWYERGLKDYRQERYTQALVEFNKALEIDSSHPQALDMMNKTYEKLKTTIPE